MEVKDWREANDAFSMCPWDFQSCESIEEALNRIWKKPVPKDLHVGFDALQKSVTELNVAHVKLGVWKQAHFCILYTLRSGAELFGGAPSEQSVGLELDDEVSSAGLRRRGEAATRSWKLVAGKVFSYILKSALHPHEYVLSFASCSFWSSSLPPCCIRCCHAFS
ncbi:unnamed protein product [Effrenium voratum]|uniref:Uncharacterized protein n=1 Tax=Effrenium voratum TaxID=2562239 RepID=A0AA36N8V3_9DINO|nr:unnamed protein product [Effrenium voratum]